MVMIIMRALLLAIVLASLVIPAYAAVIDVDVYPKTLIVPVGGYNSSVMTVTVDSAGEYNTSFVVSYTDRDYIDASLEGPYLDPDLTQKASDFTVTDFGDFGYIVWQANSSESYYFKLNVTATGGVGQEFDVILIPNTEQISIITTVDVLPIPELATITLSAVGIAIGLILMRRGL